MSATVRLSLPAGHGPPVLASPAAPLGRLPDKSATVYRITDIPAHVSGWEACRAFDRARAGLPRRPSYTFRFAELESC